MIASTNVNLFEAHYACDCWDVELLTSSGWVECVGCADRSAYDLAVHSKQTGKPLVVREHLEHPRIVQEWKVEIEKKKFGPFYKKDSKAIEAYVFPMLSPFSFCTLFWEHSYSRDNPFCENNSCNAAVTTNERQNLTELSSIILATTQEQREKLTKEMKEAGKIVLDVSGLVKSNLVTTFLLSNMRPKQRMFEGIFRMLSNPRSYRKNTLCSL